MTRLPLPAATLHVLSGGLHAHAPAILFDPFASGRPVTDQKPRLLLAFFPHRTQLRLVLMLLPEPYRAKPRLTWRTDHLRTGLPLVKVAVALALSILLLFNAQDIMPAVGLAQLNEFETTQATIGDQGAVGFS